MSTVIKITFDGQERLWHTALANVDPGYFGLIFEFRFASQYSLDNAGIDKIDISPGQCQPKGNSICGYDDYKEIMVDMETKCDVIVTQVI